VGVDDSQSPNYLVGQGSRHNAEPIGRHAHFCNRNDEEVPDMNCRFTPIDARNSILMRALVIVDGFTRVALHHCPGEGSGEP